jgi:plastocyanin
MRTKLLIVFLIFAVLISGCTGQKTETKTTNMTEKPNTVLIKGFAFDPATITIAKGITVTWMNMDSAPHTVVATGNAFISETLNNGRSFMHTFNETGTFEYKCGIHPNMIGKVIVN